MATLQAVNRIQQAGYSSRIQQTGYGGMPLDGVATPAAFNLECQSLPRNRVGNNIQGWARKLLDNDNSVLNKHKEGLRVQLSPSMYYSK